MPGKSHNQRVGKKGEIIATGYLQRCGYQIVARNYRAGRGEIDIIASLKNLMVFVEVKARLTQEFGHPEEAVTPKKAEKLIETAEIYLEETGWEGAVRFDIIAVDLSERDPVTHFEDAFH